MSEEEDDVFSLDDLGVEDEDSSESSSNSDVAPKEGVAAPASEEKKSSKEASAFSHYQASNDAGDDELYEADPEFMQSLSDLEDIPSADNAEEIESVPIDPNLLKEEKISWWSKFLLKIGVILIPYYFLKRNIANLFSLAAGGNKQLIAKVKDGVKYFLGEGKAKGIAKINVLVSGVKNVLGQTLAKTKFLSLKGKAFLVLSILVFSALIYFIRPILRGEFMHFISPKMINSFDEVADSSIKYNQKLGMEKFNNPFRFPEYAVQLKRLVVNLKRETYSINKPLGLFEFYLLLSNQEAAVELQSRESEVLDMIQRVVEGKTYKELRKVEGKQRLKLLIRKELNQVINRGRVKKVFIKSMSLKP